MYISSNNTNYSNARERNDISCIKSISSNNTNYSNARELPADKQYGEIVQIIQITAMPENKYRNRYSKGLFK